MNKFLIGAGIAIVLLVAGLPPVFGLGGEAAIRRGIESMAPNPYAQLELESYDRGLYASDAVFVFSYSDAYWDNMRAGVAAAPAETPEAAGQRDEILALIDSLAEGLRVEARLLHGPLYLVPTAGVGLAHADIEVQPRSADLRDALAELGMPYLMTAETRTGLSGTTTFSAEVPPFYADEAGATVDFSGMTMAGRYSPMNAGIEYSGLAKRVVATGDLFEVDVLNLQFDADMTMVTPVFWAGDTDIVVERLALLSRADMLAEPVTASGLGVNVRTGVDAGDGMGDGTGFFNIAYRLDSVDGLDGAALADMRLNLGMRHLDLDALARYYDLVQTMTLESVTEAGDVEALSADMVATLDALMAGSPEFSIEPLAFRLNDERLDANLRLAVNGARAVPFAELAVTPPEQLFAMFTVDGRIEISETLARSVASTLTANQLRASLPPDTEITEADIQAAAEAQSSILLVGFVQRGWVDADAETGLLSSRFRFGEGQLEVNGNLVPLAPTSPPAPPEGG